MEGRLTLSLLHDRSVQMVFKPVIGAAGNSSPIQAKDTGQAWSDLVTRFGISFPKAQAYIAQLQRTGHIDLPVSIDGRVIAYLFQSR
ncbi:MAG: hypothetical protein WAO35_29215 [Terriglobia bacterium]